MMVYNDEVADYYMEFLEERGLHVPEDISLVSFDDAESVRLYSKEPMSQNATDSIDIHCPLCGAVLRQISCREHRICDIS